MTEVLLGLGSNVDRARHLTAALDALSPLMECMHCSPVFESVAVGYSGPNFYNFVVQGQTQLPLLDFDRHLKAIEAANGRYAPDRKGLPLDIDVLLYGDAVGVFGDGGLVLPRPEILHNAFVLWPMALLVPEQVHPTTGQSFAQLWQEAKIGQQLWPVAFEWRGQALTPPSLLAAYPAP